MFVPATLRSLLPSLRLPCRSFCVATNPARVAIVGSGPAGFYAACGIRRQLVDAFIDLYEKLPVPFGLVRFGVAPDHPEVKNCINQFEKFASESGEKFRFFGNVQVGRDVLVSELLQAYDAVILAYGAELEKPLGLEGISPATKNFFSSRSFVGWYNGLPDSARLQVDLRDLTTAVIFGHGNVALDIARILLSPREKLGQTDINLAALKVLQDSSISKVYLVGRRGPLQVSFTIKEFREMIGLSPDVTTRIQPAHFRQLKQPAIVDQISRPRRRLIQLMTEVADGKFSSRSNPASKQLLVEFLMSPSKALLTPSGSIGGVEVGINQLSPDLEGGNVAHFERNAKAIATGKSKQIECQMIVSSIGYQSHNIESLIPFDSRRNCIKVTSGGQIEGIPNGFAAGWCAHGPSGVLATTSADAVSVARNVADTLSSLVNRQRKGGAEEVTSILSQRGVHWTDWSDWLTLDQIERSRGSAHGRPREKIVSVEEMLQLMGETK